MASQVTKRLAITGIDFEACTSPKIFRILESVVNNAVLTVSLHRSSQGTLYGVVELTNNEAAKKVYDAIDGFEIENTGNIFDLSFIPDDAVLTTPLDMCTSSDGCFDLEEYNDKNGDREDMFQMSEDLNVDFDIPDKFKEKAVEEIKMVDKCTNKDTSEDTISKKLKQKSVSEPDDFKFDANDDRFGAIFENDDFMIDASNKKSKVQKASKIIAEERRRRRGDES